MTAAAGAKRHAADDRFIATMATPWIALALAPAAAIVVMLVLFPLGAAVWTSVASAEGPTLARYVAFFSTPRSYDALLHTVGMAGAATLGSILLSLALALAIRRMRVGRATLRTLVTLPLAVPVLIAAYALTLFFAEHGLFNYLLVHVLGIAGKPLVISYTWTGLVLACVWRFFPYTALVVIAAIEGLNQDIEDAAACAGARPHQVFLRITLPLLVPAVITGSVLTFVGAFGTFSIPLIMGRGEEMLAVVAYRHVTGGFDWGAAATVVVVMAVIQLALLGAYRRRLSGRS
ncbi:MAG: ABC transporter permease subunit [Alphaproteobacteria bacterium]|nr:ABC transporter permease subunit [Alphaproteobacteria bacterium]